MVAAVNVNEALAFSSNFRIFQESGNVLFGLLAYAIL